VVGERLIDEHDLLRAQRVGAIGIGRDVEARDDRVAAQVDVVDVEEAVLRVVGMEGETQEPALVVACRIGNQVVDVQEGPGQDLAVLEDLDHAALLDDEQPGIIWGRRAVDRPVEIGCHPNGGEGGRVLERGPEAEGESKKREQRTEGESGHGSPLDESIGCKAELGRPIDPGGRALARVRTQLLIGAGSVRRAGLGFGRVHATPSQQVGTP